LNVNKDPIGWCHKIVVIDWFF